MSRVYFNGVSGVAFNGHLISFLLDDTYQQGGAGLMKNSVVELISELEAVEGVCLYLLSEIGKMKQVAGQSATQETKVLPQSEPKDASKLTLGPRLNRISVEHG